MPDSKKEYLGLTIDLSRDELFDELGKKRLQESYMMENETSPQERYAFVSKKFGSNLEHSQRLYEYASKHWLSYSTPILSIGKSKRGMPISCFLSMMDDTAEGLVDTLSEVSWLTMLGGGVSVGVQIRSSDDKSVGVMPHLKMYDASTMAYRQGKTRRGSYAMYLDISHPDIIPFIEMRKPTGDPNLRCQNLHNAVNIPDEFMQIIENCMKDPNYDDSWKLIDPASKEVKEVVSAKYLWQKLLELRITTGEPYFHFTDASNRALPQWLKDKGLKIYQSNLCNEIYLPTAKDRTAVCCLSSVNLVYFDEWKNDKLFLRDVVEMLDNVLQYFIDHAPKSIKRAIYSAKRERSIGVGVLGFHSYLQNKMIPFEGIAAKAVNNMIFKHIRSELDKANTQLAKERGTCPDADGYGDIRFSHLMAIAPTASTSIIMGNVSPSIEPYRANAYRQDTLSGFWLNKNQVLEKILIDIYGHDKIEEIWSSIIANDGSVQHLKELDEQTKEVFKTAIEIDQRWIIEHAADRQKYIDQGQSLNLFFRPNVNVKYLHAVHFLAWKRGLKGLYYCRSEKISKGDKISEKIERKRIEDMDMKQIADGEDCLACQS